MKILGNRGRASPEDISLDLAAAANVDAGDASFKRNVYRDLKELADEGQVQVSYTLPDGSEVSEDDIDKYKNIRVQYFVASEQSDIRGAKRVAHYGGAFERSTATKLDWSIAEELPAKPSVCFTCLTPASTRFTISVGATHLPIILLVSRLPDSDEFRPPFGAIEEKYGYRTAVFYTWENTVSRPVKGTRLCHASVSVRKDLTVTVTDLGSSTGTFYQPAIEDDVAEFLALKSRGKTRPLKRNLMADERQKIEKEIGQLKLPLFVWFGDFKVLVHNIQADSK
jgi:hypothetical protein